MTRLTLFIFINLMKSKGSLRRTPSVIVETGQNGAEFFDTEMLERLIDEFKSVEFASLD